MSNEENTRSSLELVEDYIYELANIASDKSKVVISSIDKRLSKVSISELITIVENIAKYENGVVDLVRRDFLDTDRNVFSVEYSMSVDSGQFGEYLFSKYNQLSDDQLNKIQLLQNKYLDDQVLAYLRFDGTNLFIDLSGEKYFLSKPQYGGNPFELFSYVFSTDQVQFNTAEIELKLNISFTRSISKILDDSGLSKELKLAFADVSKGKFVMRKTLRVADLKKHKLSVESFRRQVLLLPKLD
jgi:hypothetical protein